MSAALVSPPDPRDAVRSAVGCSERLPDLIVERTPVGLGTPDSRGIRRRADGRLAETIRIGHGDTWWRAFEARLGYSDPFWCAFRETGTVSATGEPGVDMLRGWSPLPSLDALLAAMRRTVCS